MIAAGTAGCGPPTPPGRTAAWRDDIAYLAQKLPQVHVGGLDGVTRSQWNAAADQLEARVPRLNDSQIIQGLERIIALLHDDETYLDGGPVGPVYPMALQWIGSGLYVVGAPPGNPGLLGARIIAVGGHALSQILAALRPLVDYQDQGVLAAAEVNDLIQANTLKLLGFASSTLRADFTVQLVGATATTTVALDSRTADTLPWAIKAAQVSDFRHYFPRQLETLTALGSANLSLPPLPLYEQNLTEPYWMTVLPGGDVYLKYNECLDTSGFAKVAANAIAAVRSHPGSVLIVDLRNNPGGYTAPFQALIEGIRADPQLDRPGRVIALVNQLTYSSATLDANALRVEAKATLIGEAPEDPIDEYGNSGRVLRLPFKDINVNYTTKIVNPSKAALAIPDIPVAPTLQEVIDGQDPVLQLALSYNRPSGSQP